MDEPKLATACTMRDEPPGLGIIANCMTPYRANLHGLIADGIPELKIHTLITHGASDFSWDIRVPESIHPSYFRQADDSPHASPFHAPRREWQKGKQLIDYLFAHNVRAVICMGYRYLSYLRVIRWCQRANIPLFYRNDSNIRSERNITPIKQLGKRLIYAWWMPRVRGIMSMGELGDQFFVKYGAKREQLYRVPYTPNYDRFARVDPHDLNAFRERFSLRYDRKYILYSGRLVPVKRVDLLIDAFVAIASSRPEWDLLVVGDGVLRQTLQERIPAEIRQRIVWTGFLQESDCAVAYHAAELLVLPSDTEPWALVVQEALAAGRPVVASDAVGAAHDLVTNRKNGGIFPAGDLSALKECLLEATDEVNLRAYQVQARPALDAWRERINPVAEVRRALVESGVLADVPANEGIRRHNLQGSERVPC